MQKKRLFLLIVCLGLMGVVYVSAAAQTPTSSVSFKTPEDAISAYIGGVAQADVSKILQASVIDEMGDNFKFDLYINRLHALQPYQAPAPSEYPFYAQMNQVQQEDRILSQVRILAYSLLSPEDVTNTGTIIMDANKTAQFVKAVDPTGLASLTVKKIVLSNKTVMSTARYIANATTLAQIYGADEYTERLVLLQFEGNDYVGGFTLLRYGESWKIYSAGSPVGNTVSTGAVQQMTESDFDDLTQ